MPNVPTRSRKPTQQLAVPIDEMNELYETILRHNACGRRRLILKLEYKIK